MHTEVDVPNPQFQLVPGMYASVKIPLHTADESSDRAGAGISSRGPKGRESCSWWDRKTRLNGAK